MLDPILPAHAQLVVAQHRYPCPDGHATCLATGVCAIATITETIGYIIDYECGTSRHVDNAEFVRAVDLAREGLDSDPSMRIDSLYEPTIDPDTDAWEGAGGVLLEEIAPHLTGRIDAAVATIDEALGEWNASSDTRKDGSP